MDQLKEKIHLQKNIIGKAPLIQYTYMWIVSTFIAN